MKRGRTGTVVVLIVSLIASGFLRAAASGWQARQPRNNLGAGAGSAIGSMNSFALALLLGGLRGPLVMFLWATSETQKADHNLEDFDTKVEWIRRLQPEFATVHIFQIWNKAYNISVLLASPANRYIAIMQALDYAWSVDAEMPGDINILASASQVYSNKLDGPAVQEKPFYTRQFREETMTDPARAAAFPEDKSFHRLWGASLTLDEQNRILPQFLRPDPNRGARPPGAAEWNDGSALQYLKKYEPFPYGISPIAMGFNYSKRAEVALRSEGQKPLNLSGMVIDSRPGLDLKTWAEEESTRGRALEGRAFKIDLAGLQGMDYDVALGKIPPSAPPVDAHDFAAAVYAYEMAERVARDARVEYDRHLSSTEYVSRYRVYQSHLDDLALTATLARADHDYLLARDASRTDTRDLLRSATDNYRAAMVLCQRIILKYYTSDVILRSALPPGAAKSSIADLTDAQVSELYPRAAELTAKAGDQNNADNRDTYEWNMARALIRLQQLSGSRVRQPS